MLPRSSPFDLSSALATHASSRYGSSRSVAISVCWSIHALFFAYGCSTSAVLMMLRTDGDTMEAKIKELLQSSSDLVEQLTEATRFYSISLDTEEVQCQGHEG
ncbi:hypothetical protein B566_EDAN016431 [Ephemera danica]|nr:hypothetical protein B566_EDAN016431 [Ephemera danica]